MLSLLYELSAQPCLLGMQLRKCCATKQKIIDFAGMETFAKEHYKSFCEHKRNAPTANSEKKSLFFFSDARSFQIVMFWLFFFFAR